MFCPQCATECSDSVQFCPKCGHNLASAKQEGTGTPEFSAQNSAMTLANAVYTNLNYIKWLMLVTMTMMLVQFMIPKIGMIMGQLSSILSILLIVFSFVYVFKVKNFFSMLGADQFAALCGRIKNSFILLIIVNVLVSLVLVGFIMYASVMDMKEGVAITSDSLANHEFGPHLLAVMKYAPLASLIMFFFMAYPFVKFFYVRNVIAQFISGADITAMPVRGHGLQMLAFCAVSVLIIMTSIFLDVYVS